MRNGFRLASLRTLLAVIIAAAGLAGLMTPASAQADGHMTVIVHDEAGDVVQGAYVAFDGIDEEGTVYPNDGSFTTEGEYAPGVYTFVASADGYLAQEGEVEIVDGNASVTVTLTEDPGPLGYMTVIVEDEAGDIIEGAYVAFHDIDEEGTVYPNDGSFTTSQQYEPGTYGFTVSADGYASQDGELTIVNDNVSTTVTLLAESGPLPLALVYLEVSSSDPTVANTLPEGSTWVIYDNSGAGHGLISSGEFTELELPVTVEVPEGVPYGEMLITIDGLPAFEAYEWTHDIVDDVEYLDIVLDPVAGDDDDDDNGDDDKDNGDDKDDADDDKDDGDDKDEKDKDKTEDVKTLPVVGSGPGGSDGSGLHVVLALFAAIVAGVAGLRLRATTA